MSLLDDTLPLPPYVKDILARLERTGFSAYAVGGCIRDSMLELPVHDWDICASALPEQIMQLFSDFKTIPTGIKHGTITVITDKGFVEITTFRTDGSYSDHRRPENVSFTDSLEEDLSRRDFTVNAMAYGLSGVLVDTYGGQNDLSGKVIRCVGDPLVRFTEDALRILRMYRFAFRLGFEIDEQTRMAAVEKSVLVSRLSRERISEEFGCILSGPRAYDALLTMERDGVLSQILPSPLRIESLIDQLPTDLMTRLSFLLSLNSLEKIENILRRNRYSVDDIRTVSYAARLTASSPPNSKAEIKGALRKYDVEAFNIFLSILKTVNTEVYNKISSNYAAVLTGKECYLLKDLKISGDDITALGVSGKMVGFILNMLLDHVVYNPEDNKKEQLIEILIELLGKNENNIF